MSSIILKPRMSEKAYGLSLVSGTYVFDVPVSANKNTIADAVEKQFNVSVIKVRTARAKGKVKLSYQKRNRPIQGKRADVKHAYVQLKEGDKLSFFEAPEEDKKSNKKSTKKSDKKEKK